MSGVHLQGAICQGSANADTTDEKNKKRAYARLALLILNRPLDIRCFGDAYFHERRSLNNFHRDRVITFEQIAE
ncbi:hypothetical protein CQA71_13585 [Escherichia coli]|nr:hypothetical protein CQA71_13585 [Escherichia coli]